MRFSIVIPVYNVAPYLPTCLDSLLEQSFSDWEAICVDDGSTDASSDILEEYASKDFRIRVLHQRNQGVSVARNVGLGVARGAWIGFLDPDDALDGRWLSVANECIDETVDLVRLGTSYWCDGAARPSVNDAAVLHRIEGTSALLSWGTRTFTKSGWVWAIFVRREIILGPPMLRFPERVRFSEDSLFSLCVLGRVRTAVEMDFKGHYYRIRQGSACGQPKDEDERCCFFESLTHVILALRQKMDHSQLESERLKRVLLGFAWSNLVVWALCPKNCGAWRLMRAHLIRVMQALELGVNGLAIHWRVSACLFVWLGLVAPIVITSKVVRLIGRVCH